MNFLKTLALVTMLSIPSLFFGQQMADMASLSLCKTNTSLLMDMGPDNGILLETMQAEWSMAHVASRSFISGTGSPNVSHTLSEAMGEESFMMSTYNEEGLATRLSTALAMKRRKSGMEKTGRILTYIGVPLAIVGGIMVAGADELYYECVNGNCQGDARGGFGVVLLGAGVGLSATGGVLWVIGSKRR